MGTKPASFLLRRAIFALSPTPFYLIPHAVSPYPQSHLFTFSPLNALSPFHLFTLPPFPLFPISPFHPFTLKCPFTLSPFKGRSHLFTLSPFHPLIPDCNCCKQGMMGTNSNKDGGFLQPSSPLLNHRKHTCLTHPCPSQTNCYAADAMMLHAQ